MNIETVFLFISVNFPAASQIKKKLKENAQKSQKTKVLFVS